MTPEGHRSATSRADASSRQTRPSSAEDPRLSAPRDAIERSEHLATLIRMRLASRVGAILWSASLVFDLLNTATLGGSLAQLLTLRAVGTAIILGVHLRLRSAREIGPRALRLLALWTFTSCSVLFALMAACANGLPSPYFGGAMIMLVAWGVVVSEHWRQGLVDGVAVTLAYPVGLLLATGVSRPLAAQLHDAVAVSVFTSNLGNLIVAYTIVVLGGHVSWRLRRQVFATRSLGRYRLKHLLGRGGMGEVWAAHHVALKRDVAVKILRGDESNRDEHAISRFEREVSATTGLLHPNTIRIFDYGVSDDGVPYYAMELLEGKSLATLVEGAGPLAPARAVHLMTQAARALAEAHGKGIVHRDVKPENLFVVSMAGEHDFLKVLDFGIAKVLSVEQAASLTRSGAFVGTPAWLAPETIKGVDVDARADVYALGAVLYFTLTGAPPFEKSSGLAMLSAHLHERPVAPSARRGEPLPADLEAVVLRCLAKNPDERYASSRELADALDACGVSGTWTRAMAAGAVRVEPSFDLEALANAKTTEVTAPQARKAGR